jgi:hypothetical protein
MFTSTVGVVARASVDSLPSKKRKESMAPRKDRIKITSYALGCGTPQDESCGY